MVVTEEKKIKALAYLRVAEKKVKNNIWPKIKLLEAQAEYNQLLNAPELDYEDLKLNNHPQVELFEKNIKFDQTTKELVAKATNLKKELAELSNQLHKTTGRDLVLLLREVSKKQAEKERAWTDYHNYKKTGTIQKESSIEEKDENLEFMLLKLESEKELEMQKRSRAKKKLESGTLSDQQQIKQEEKYSFHDMNIKDLQERIKNLKNK